MVTVDLITGFLGSGKTTFIQRYVKYLQRQGLSVRIIENEFGETNIDTQLLAEEDCEISDLAGLCMCCVGKDAFIRMLQESASTGCDRILVEPSGIYDVDEFFEVLSLPEIAASCEIGSILTILDPMGLDHMTEESEYLMFTQMLASGMVLVSKSQLISEEELEKAVDEYQTLMVDKGCPGGILAEICTKSWEDLTQEDYEECMEAGYARIVHEREEFVHAEIFRSMQVSIHASDEEDLRETIKTLFYSPACGVIYRIKGFAKDISGQFYEVNCTTETMSVKKTQSVEENMVIIGQYLRKKEILERIG